MILYQQGNYRAFEELYERHSGKVYAYLQVRLLNKSEADDLLQLVFLRLHEHRARYSSKFPFLPWIFSITRNALIDSYKKKKPIPVESSQLDRVPAETDDESHSNIEEDLKGVLASLTPAQHELIELRFKEGLSFEEIGQRLGLNSPSVRKRVSRTINGLRKLFGGKSE